MKSVVFEISGDRHRPRGTLDFAPIADRARMPWRFLERHIAVDGLRSG
jgi:hypothetical protein